MKSVDITLDHHAYEILIGKGLLKDFAGHLRQFSVSEKCAVFTDENVGKIYGETLRDNLSNAGFNVVYRTFPGNEEHKTIDSIQRFYAACLENRLDRKTPVIALGGGVTGDVVGFAAATYVRGVPFFQIPTSLLAMVDSSVGGKVGYNHPMGKNMIGAFYHPLSVLVDTDVLQSLPDNEFRNGLAECVKHAVIRDQYLFKWYENNLVAIKNKDRLCLEELIFRNVSIKAGIVKEDEKEAGVRALLNFGHTFGHAVESVTGYTRFKHGEAVALGCVAATFLSVYEKYCDDSVLSRLEALLNAFGLPVKAELPECSELINAMGHDKKVQDGVLRLILPRRIGEAEIMTDIPEASIRKAWEYIGAH